jgi:predicted nucleic acid-binding protein
LIYLLDTMVVSEPSKTRANPGVTAWLQAQEADALAISMITYGQVAYGVQKLLPSGRKARLELWLRIDIEQGFGQRKLPVDAAVAQRWAALRAGAGRTLPLADGLIAATALVHGLKLVTRNRRDFQSLGVRLFDPWAAA